MSNRLAQINETLHHELGLIINEMAKQEWGFFTITSVQTSPDLKHSRIWVSAEDKTIHDLNNLTHEIRTTLRPRITFKHIPTLEFIKEDESISRVQELLEKIDEE